MSVHSTAIVRTNLPSDGFARRCGTSNHTRFPFDSIIQLAAAHHGWTAVRKVEEGVFDAADTVWLCVL